MNDNNGTGNQGNASALRRVMVIGGGGFLGRNLIESLVGKGIKVRCVDIIKPSWTCENVDFIERDFSSKRHMKELFDGCDAVFHLASTTLPKSSNDDPRFDVRTNLVGTVGLLELAVEASISRFIFVSSGGTVYGVPESVPVSEDHSTNPRCSYGIVKLAIEKYLKLFHCLYGLSTINIRLSNPYGRYQRVDRAHGAIAVFCGKALRGETIDIWGDGSIVRDFIYVDDAIEALIKALNADCSGIDINVGSGEGASLNDVVKHLEKFINKGVICRHRPSRDFDVPAIYLDIDRARSVMGWHPKTRLSDGIEHMLSWLQNPE